MAPPASTAVAKKSARATFARDSAKEPAPKASSAKENKVPAPRRVHPPYFEMIKEAIIALKERTGSSQYAIAKFIEEKQKDLPSNFKRLLLVQLKKLVASGKLTKVKNSFKLSATSKPSSATSEKPRVVVKSKKEVPKKVTAGTGGKKSTAATSGKPKNAAAAKKEPARKVTGKSGEEKGKKRKAVAPAPKVKKTPVKKPKSIKSPAKKLNKRLGGSHMG